MARIRNRLSPASRRITGQMHGLADDLRAARASLGLSRARVAKSAGVARSTVERAEAGATSLGLDVVAAILAAVGIDLSVRTFPSDRFRVRDSRHAAYVESLLILASPSWRARAEVSAGEHGRSADLVVYGADTVIHIEVERRLTDVQAQLRNAQRKRAALAQATDRPVRLVIAVPDTRSNREAFRPHGTLIRSQLPATSREVLRAIRTDERLATDGFLWLRPRNLNRAASSGSLAPEGQTGRRIAGWSGSLGRKRRRSAPVLHAPAR